MRTFPWLLALGCAGSPAEPVPPPAPACGEAGLVWQDPAPGPRDDALHVGQLQAAATHNSYHLEPDAVLDASHAYTHPSLADQLAAGVRGFELDVHLRDDGGLDVFHLPGIDPLTTCATLVDCLAPLCSFSAKNPGHAPLMVWIEPKDDLDAITPGYQPLLGQYSAIEEEILSVFPRERLHTPDDWARGEADAGAATRAFGPPLLGEVRGKLLFGLIDAGEHRDAYTADDPTLAGRLLFPDSDDASAAYAALRKDADPTELADLHAQGLLVTVNVDGAGDDDATNQATRDAHVAAGANWLATDFTLPRDGAYWLDWPTDGGAVRCNPATAPADCVPADLEQLSP